MLSPTAKVILGMVRLGRRTGYEIKQLVDVSTRFFWAASYGQIYPELKRLEDDGLLASSDASVNGRRPASISYSSTPSDQRSEAARPSAFRLRETVGRPNSREIFAPAYGRAVL